MKNTNYESVFCFCGLIHFGNVLYSLLVFLHVLYLRSHCLIQDCDLSPCFLLRVLNSCFFYLGLSSIWNEFFTKCKVGTQANLLVCGYCSTQGTRQKECLYVIK